DRDRVVLHAVERRAEHLERLALVLLLRVALRIAAQVNALTQIIERGDVLLPVQIELPQHDVLLELVDDLRSDLLDLALVILFRGRDEIASQPGLIEAVVLLEQARDIELEPEIALERL